MADLRLTIGGDASGATQALREVSKETTSLSEATSKNAESVGESIVKWELLREAVMKAVEVGRDSVKLYAEQTQADRQLALAVGDSSEAFLRQADAIEKSLGIDAIKTEKMQALLYRFGEAPQAIDKTVRALHDYAAATGTDALAAAEMLTSSVATGRQAFKELGLQYESTGDKSKDLQRITEALSKKVGGAAETDATSAAGAARIAAAEFEEMQKALGKFITEAAQSSGAIGSLTEALRGVQTALGMNETTERQKQKAAIVEEIAALQDYVIEYQKADQAGKRGFWANFIEAREKGLSAQSPDEILTRYQKLLEAAAKLDEAAAKAGIGPTGLGHGGKTQKAIDDAKRRRDEEADEEEKAREEQQQEMQRQGIWEADQLEKKNAEQRKAAAEAFRIKVESDMRQTRQNQENAKAIAEWDKRQLELEKENAKAEAEFQRQLGEQVGGAFAQGMASAISELGKGGEVDIGSILVDIMVTAAGMGLTATGFGYLAPITGALGGAAKAAMHTTKRHEGGWIEAPRYHSGAWVGADEQPAILQHGERVLSRAEVRGMGGPSGVDAAARGGAGASVTVQTFDGQTTRDFFERAGGRALLNAVRTGRGAPALLFGGG